MLSAFLEDIDSCRDAPAQSLPRTGPSIVEQVAALSDRARCLERQFRESAERRGPEFQTPELGAVLWWAGMASHKAAAASEGARAKTARNAWEDAFFEIHALMYETMSALSLLAVAEEMIQRMEAEGVSRVRPN
jgi:hypothetical protein